MKNIWTFISMVLAGVVVGLVVGVKWLGDKTVFRGKIRINQRGRGNIQDPTLSAEIRPQKKRDDKKQSRIERRNERKKRKDLKRLDNL